MIRAIGCFGANSNPGSLAGLLDAEYNSRTLHYKSMLYMFQGRENDGIELDQILLSIATTW